MYSLFITFFSFSPTCVLWGGGGGGDIQFYGSTQWLHPLSAGFYQSEVREVRGMHTRRAEGGNRGWGGWGWGAGAHAPLAHSLTPLFTFFCFFLSMLPLGQHMYRKLTPPA